MLSLPPRAMIVRGAVRCSPYRVRRCGAVLGGSQGPALDGRPGQAVVLLGHSSGLIPSVSASEQIPTEDVMSAALRDLSPSAARGPSARHYLCFPPAGGSASLLDHIAAVSPGHRVWAHQYPGRADRVTVPFPGDLEDLALEAGRALIDLLGEAGTRDTTLVGFSMGGLVALETAHHLVALGARPPAGLVIVGAMAPQRRTGENVHTSPDMTLVRSRGGGPVTAAPLEAEAEAEAETYARHLLEADLRLVTRYPGPRFSQAPCPVGVLCGAEDPWSADGAGTTAWANWSNGPFCAWEVPGRHLGLLDPHRATEFWTHLARIEERQTARPATPPRPAGAVR